VQGFTADANAKLGTKGASAGAEAKVFEGSGQLSATFAGHTFSVKGTFDLVGVGASGHITWDEEFSAGGKVIFGAVGAGLSLTIAPPPPH
jgi:hypothetical protein